jgi:predicted small lipoprotein YifL
MIARRLVLIPLALLAFASCGLKGPLYLPETPAAEVPAPADEEERKERTRDSGSQAPAVPTDTTSASPAPEGQP